MNFSEIMKNQYVIIGFVAALALVLSFFITDFGGEEEVAANKTSENAKEVQVVSNNQSDKTLEVIVEAEKPIEEEPHKEEIIEEITGEKE
tara:strand:- start:3746 stop:4015 length:270 start_codon:yes stop_codon:yes gene_type:complete